MNRHIIHILLVLTTFGFAQELPTVIPPTPEVASLGKYIETPVNEFTGIPKIQIPIYEINQHRINHSINLSYHAQGVKVEEIASRVGMGWTLNAGGMIHRQKRSAPDESGYLNTGQTVFYYTVEEFLNFNLDYNDPATNSFLTVLFNDHNAHDVDFEPDLFTFSFGGYSGKFFFDQKTLEPVFEEASALKVEWINFDYFKIITPDGLQYYFGKNKDGTSSTKQIVGGIYDAIDVWTIGDYAGAADETDPSVTNNPEYVATWYLKEIYDPTKNESITFDYEEYNLGRLKRRLSSSVLALNQPYGLDISFQHTLSEKYEEEYVLTQINFNSGRIEFIKDPVERLDLSGSHRLQQINIYSDSKIIKSFGLHHNMIQTTNNGNGNEDLYDFYNNINDRRYRLFLSNLKEYGIDKVNNVILYNQYKQQDFEYSNPERLPHRFSSAQDFWGFHNGANSNKNLLPKNLTVSLNGFHELGHADRRVHQNFAQDGVLNKITYPTGGYSEYIYESNQAKKSVNPRAYYEGDFDPIYYDYETTQYNFHQANADGYFSNGGHPYYTSNFTIDDFASSDLEDTQLIRFNYFNYNNYDQYDTSQEEPYWEAFIQKFDKNTNTWPNFSVREYNFNDSGNNEIGLASGQYRIVINWIGDAGTHGTYNANYHGPDDWRVYFDILTQTEFSNEDYIFTGGLRVKEIKSNDLEGNINTTSYLYEDENGDTSGNLLSLPYRFSNLGFYYYRTVYYQPINTPPGTQHPHHFEYYSGRKYSSDISIALATTQSSYSGYTKVTKVRENGEIGKTEYNFSFERNSLNMRTLYSYPSAFGGQLAYVIAPPPLVSEELQRGKLLSQIDYNASGDIVQEITNTYELAIHHSLDAITLGLAIGHQLTYNPITGLPYTELVDYDIRLPLLSQPLSLTFAINKYQLFSRSNLLKEKSTTIYDIHGENPLTNTTTYAYENAVFPTLQTGSLTANSNGEVIETKTYYPDDITSTTSLLGGALQGSEYTAIERLKYNGQEFRVSQPIQQETYIGGELIAASRTNFSTYDNITLSSSLETSKANTDLEERIEYKDYDDKGNPLEVSKADGVHISYIWGYNKQYPVAKVENATRVEIEALPGFGNDFHTGASGLASIQENTLRTHLPNAMVSTYTYEPLVGVTSMTDPRGYTMTYHYDEFNRLEFVKDADGNLVSENKYNYKN